MTNAARRLAADNKSVHQADDRLPAMRLRSLWSLQSFLLVQPDNTGLLSSAEACSLRG